MQTPSEIDARRCEGKGQCVVVCPYDVFEVGSLSGAGDPAREIGCRTRVIGARQPGVSSALVFPGSPIDGVTIEFKVH